GRQETVEQGARHGADFHGEPREAVLHAIAQAYGFAQPRGLFAQLGLEGYFHPVGLELPYLHALETEIAAQKLLQALGGSHPVAQETGIGDAEEIELRRFAPDMDLSDPARPLPREG